MAWVGMNLKDHEAPTPCHRQDHQPPYLIPDQAAQGPIEPGLEHLLEWHSDRTVVHTYMGFDMSWPELVIKHLVKGCSQP